MKVFTQLLLGCYGLTALQPAVKFEAGDVGEDYLATCSTRGFSVTSHAHLKCLSTVRGPHGWLTNTDYATAERECGAQHVLTTVSKQQTVHTVTFQNHAVLNCNCLRTKCTATVFKPPSFELRHFQSRPSDGPAFKLFAHTLDPPAQTLQRPPLYQIIGPPNLGFININDCNMRHRTNNKEIPVVSNGCPAHPEVTVKTYPAKSHLLFTLGTLPSFPSSTYYPVCTLTSSAYQPQTTLVEDCGARRLRKRIATALAEDLPDARLRGAQTKRTRHSKQQTTTTSTTAPPAAASPPSSVWQNWRAPQRRLSASFQDEINKRLKKLNADESIVNHIKQHLSQEDDDGFDPLVLMPYAPGSDYYVGLMDSSKNQPFLGRFGSEMKWDNWDASFSRDNRLGDTAVSVGKRDGLTVSQSVGVKNRAVDTNVKYHGRNATVDVDAGHDLELDQYHVGTFVQGYGVGIKRENDQDATGVLVETPNVTVATMSNLLDRNYGGRIRIRDVEVMARHDFDQHIFEDKRKMATELAVKAGKNVGVAVGTDVNQEKFGFGIGINGTQFGAMGDLDDRQLKLTSTLKARRGDPWTYYIETDLPDANSRATHAVVGVGKLDKHVVTAGGGIGDDGIPEFMARWNGKNAAVQVQLDDKTNQKRKLTTGFSFGRFTYVWDSNLLLNNIPVPLVGGLDPAAVSNFLAPSS